MKIVADIAIPFLKGVFEPYAEVVYANGSDITASLVSDADALIIRTRTKCGRSLLETSKVRIIATATIGFDHIDLDYCRSRNIAVATAAGCNARGVLQWVAATLVLLARDQNFLPNERTLGIIGVGHVGSKVKEYAERWGFRVICCDPPREEREHLGFLPFEEVVRQADIVTLHVPLASDTRHMINCSNISLLHRNATLINASRGEVVDSEALLRDDLHLAIDVWENEPKIDKRILDRAFVATPHIAGYSLQGKATATAMAVDAVARKLSIPIEGWYPADTPHSQAVPIDWNTLCKTIASYCDLRAETERLKLSPDQFESIRNNYAYREEYF